MKINNLDAQLLQHIVKHADEIADTISFFGKTKEQYFNNHIYRNSCSMALQSIGENAKKLSNDFLSKEKTIPWKSIKGLRNIFAHAYDSSSFNHEMIWEAIIDDVPVLRETCSKILLDNHVDLIPIAENGHNKSCELMLKTKPSYNATMHTFIEHYNRSLLKNENVEEAAIKASKAVIKFSKCDSAKAMSIMYDLLPQAKVDDSYPIKIIQKVKEDPEITKQLAWRDKSKNQGLSL